MAIDQKNFIQKKILQSMSFARSAHFTAQSALLPLVERLANGKKEKSFARFKEHMELALPKLNQVLQKDVENISNGFYPSDVIFSESPITHFSRIPALFIDAFRAAKQKAKKESDFFESKDSEFVSEAPEYYRRNFHFQKGGYLNDDSAKLYDHQVEVLFSGTAHAMRRQIIPKMKAHFNMSDGEGLKFLEVGSGTGSLTRDIALAFPKAQIVCLDVSPHYLNFAQKKLSEFKRINYIQGEAENMSFKDESFDAVFSCYLYHELPEKIRTEVTKEKMRVLKPVGFLGIIDSLQLDDDTDLNWALEQFPIDFHEPFYKNYTQKKLEELLQSLELVNVETEVSFLTKIVTAVK